MPQEDIIRQLAELTSAFKKKVAEVFDGKETKVKVRELTFDIGEQDNAKDTKKFSALDDKIKSKCEKNEQGQIVCT